MVLLVVHQVALEILMELDAEELVVEEEDHRMALAARVADRIEVEHHHYPEVVFLGDEDLAVVLGLDMMGGMEEEAEAEMAEIVMDLDMVVEALVE
jgi:hypothetical protein